MPPTLLIASAEPVITSPRPSAPVLSSHRPPTPGVRSDRRVRFATDRSPAVVAGSKDPSNSRPNRSWRVDPGSWGVVAGRRLEPQLPDIPTEAGVVGVGGGEQAPLQRGRGHDVVCVLVCAGTSNTPAGRVPPVSNVFCPLKDGQNSVRKVVNTSGTVVASYDYDAFGNALSSPNTIDTLFRHRAFGEVYDSHLGMTYLRARWMENGTGRFGSRDPVAGYGSRPQSLHRFAYGDLNPVNRYDPSGNESVGSLGVNVSIVGTVLPIYPNVNMPLLISRARGPKMVGRVVVHNFVTSSGNSIPGAHKFNDAALSSMRQIYGLEAGFEMTVYQAPDIQMPNSGFTTDVPWIKFPGGMIEGSFEETIVDAATDAGAGVHLFPVVSIAGDITFRGYAMQMGSASRFGVIVASAGGDTIAHEVGHNLLGNGSFNRDHYRNGAEDPSNLMHEGEGRTGTHLSDRQVSEMRLNGPPVLQ